MSDLGEVPEPYKNAGLAMIVAGGMNALLSIAWGVSLVLSVWGLCLVPLPVVFLAIGSLEVWSGWQMVHGAKKPWARLTAVLGALAALLMCFGLISFALEVFAAYSLSKADVRRWLRD